MLLTRELTKLGIVFNSEKEQLKLFSCYFYYYYYYCFIYHYHYYYLTLISRENFFHPMHLQMTATTEIKRPSMSSCKQHLRTSIVETSCW